MRITVVNDYAEMVGGAERYVFSMAHLLEKHGHKVEIFGKRTWPGKAVVFTRIYNPAWSRRISRRIEEFQPDIIHCHNISYILSPSVVRAAKRHGIPVIMTLHDFHLVCPKTGFTHANGRPCTYGFGWDCYRTRCALNPYEMYIGAKLLLHRKIIAENVDCMISPSEVLAAWVKKNLGFNKVFVLPYFSDVQGDPTAPLPHNRSIVFLGRLIPEKGGEYLIRAMPYILREIPDAKLFMVGDGEHRDYLQQLAQDLDISRNAVFTGWVEKDELKEHLQMGQLICVPSICMDNYPIAIIETLCNARPVIASNIGGIPEMVKDGVNGLLFEPRDPLDLAEKAITVLSDFELSKEFAENASRSSHLYSEDHHYQGLMEIYRSVMNSTAGIEK